MPLSDGNGRKKLEVPGACISVKDTRSSRRCRATVPGGPVHRRFGAAHAHVAVCISSRIPSSLSSIVGQVYLRIVHFEMRQLFMENLEHMFHAQHYDALEGAAHRHCADQ